MGEPFGSCAVRKGVVLVFSILIGIGKANSFLHQDELTRCLRVRGRHRERSKRHIDRCSISSTTAPGRHESDGSASVKGNVAPTPFQTVVRQQIGSLYSLIQRLAGLPNHFLKKCSHQGSLSQEPFGYDGRGARSCPHRLRHIPNANSLGQCFTFGAEPVERFSRWRCLLARGGHLKSQCQGKTNGPPHSLVHSCGDELGHKYSLSFDRSLLF